MNGPICQKVANYEQIDPWAFFLDQTSQPSHSTRQHLGVNQDESLPKRQTNILSRGGNSSRSRINNSSPTAARRASRSASRNATGPQGIRKSKKKPVKTKHTKGDKTKIIRRTPQPIPEPEGSKAFHIPKKYAGRQRDLVYFEAKKQANDLGVTLQTAIDYVLKNDVEKFLEEAERLEAINNFVLLPKKPGQKRASKSKKKEQKIRLELAKKMAIDIKIPIEKAIDKITTKQIMEEKARRKYVRKQSNSSQKRRKNPKNKKPKSKKPNWVKIYQGGSPGLGKK